jgi:hypothetical protein
MWTRFAEAERELRGFKDVHSEVAEKLSVKALLI